MLCLLVLAAIPVQHNDQSLQSYVQYQNSSYLFKTPPLQYPNRTRPAACTWFDSIMLSIVLPLRVPVECNLQEQLTLFLDETQAAEATATATTTQRLDLSSYECQDDLQRLHLLRKECGQALESGFATLLDETNDTLQTLQEYAACLAECEQRGFPSWDTAANTNTNTYISTSTSNTSTALQFTWMNATNNDTKETHGTVTWERANILYNMAAFLVHQAVGQPADSRKAWTAAGQGLQQAATLVHYLRTVVLPPAPATLPAILPATLPATLPALATDRAGTGAFPVACSVLQPAFLQTWETFLLATAQRAAYEAFACADRPRHFMLAKLAAAASPLFEQAVEQCQAVSLLSSSSSLTTCTTSNNDSPLVQSWSDCVRAWELCMTALSVYHQSVVHREKQEWGLELARLTAAVNLTSMTRDLTTNAELDCTELRDLDQTLQGLWKDMESRLDQAEQENVVNRVAVPESTSLSEIPPQLVVKLLSQALDKLLPALQQPLFVSGLNPSAKRCAESFRADMDRLLLQTTVSAQEKTESGRKALAFVNLPHALTAYRQEVSGGGIPDELWSRVETVQQSRRISRLQQELWELRDAAESARHVYKTVDHQLRENSQLDNLFREQNNAFEGHDVREVQKTFQQSLQNYDRLLVAAQDGDAVLLERLEILDTDPKYKLLQFGKSQLDRLLPGREGPRTEIDVSTLGRYLVELSALFSAREGLLSSLNDKVKGFKAGAQLSQVTASGPDLEREYQAILDPVRQAAQLVARDSEANVNEQDALIRKILDENQLFMRARDASHTSSSSDSCIVMIEDAIEEIEQLSKHLQEGSDFYKVIIPKLEKLKQQVEDVSTRLTIERCEYEDKTTRQQQLANDARMAASFGGNSEMTPSSNSAPEREPRPQSYQEQQGPSRNTGGQPVPGIEAVPHDEPVVRVDDAKVANLVSMDFDPVKVVAALKKYDNNFEQALNDLLSS